MFENFRERLHMVQQDFTSGLKTLGDKSRDPKTRRRPRVEESLPYFSAGVEILSRYENSWFLLHKRTRDCAQDAEAADGDLVMLCAHWERRRSALVELQQQLQSLPSFTKELDTITANIALLEGDFEELESRLVYLESLCAQSEQQVLKQQHGQQLELYKKNRRKELEALEGELSSEHAQKVAEFEQALQQKLRERQKVYEEAFNQDMKKYLSTGYLHATHSAGSDVSVLDHMSLTNPSDQEALDDFLNSTSGSVSMASSLTSGPDLESPESLTSQSQQTPPSHNQPSNQESFWEQEQEVCSEESEEPVVQSDEEEVQPDVSLSGLRSSDESDPAEEQPALTRNLHKEP